MFTSKPIPQKRNNIGFVLLVLHNISDASILKMDLENKGYTVLIATTGQIGIQQFQINEIDLCCVSTELTDMTTIEFLTQMKEQSRKRLVPIVVLDIENKYTEEKANYVRNGAFDLIFPTEENDLLEAVIANLIEVRNSIVSLQSSDPLTGTLNQLSFEKKASTMIQDFDSSNQAFSISLLDIQNFQKMNESFGYTYTNEVLSQFSKFIQSQLSEEDFFFRLHGATFIILQSDTNADKALWKTNQLKQSSQSVIYKHDNLPFHLSFHAGIAEWVRSYDSIDQLVENAKQALSVAKHTNDAKCISFNNMDTTSILPTVRVIIVDDNRLSNKMLQKQFQSWKSPRFVIDVKSHENGYEFIQSDWYHPSDYHIILLDIVMPKMDGLEVLDQIRANFPSDRIIISMLTSRTNDQDILHALNKGADDYMVKPFHPQEVLVRIQRLASRLFT
ncbi:response regulator [Psychrobacillus sp. L3]|uniref:response regulator n=1 Tax=Psychrobacillus sp. L3 TaxID=3236891 RepID=UPI0036F33311